MSEALKWILIGAGTAIGGALGGPVGAAVGAAIGKGIAGASSDDNGGTDVADAGTTDGDHIDLSSFFG